MNRKHQNITTEHRPARGRPLEALRLFIIMAAALPVLLAALAHPALAAPDDPGNDDLLEGFDDSLPAADTDQTGSPPAGEGPSWLTFGGFLRLDASYNYAHQPPLPGQTDWRGWSKMRGTVRLEMDLRPGAGWRAFVSGQSFRDGVYAARGRENYSDEVLDNYEAESEFREVFLQGSLLPSLDLTLGRQIVAWGKSDSIRVVDVINPIDFREPGMTDLEDLRLPVTMTRLDAFAGPWRLTTLAVHEVRFDRMPVPGSDFFLSEMAAMNMEEEIPEDGGRNTEYGLALQGEFTGWDMGLYWAQYFDDTPRVYDIAFGMPPKVSLRHERLTMAGAAFNTVAGSWLFKAELARITGFRFYNDPENVYTRMDVLGGVEYLGITNNTFTLEAVDRRLLGFRPELEESPDAKVEDIVQYSLSWRGSFLREKLDLMAMASYFGSSAEMGGMQRYSASYELAPALNITGGLMVFVPGDGSNPMIYNARDNDRLFGDIKWSF
ncbi:MAG: ligand-binding protein SH3 [Deltaproteobacteria bacterium]|nr:ligand-binding protein SH3 [Deltaproteobacteria bacterium]